MAEYCLSCWNRINGKKDTEADVVLLDDLCEGCGEILPTIVRYRTPVERFLWKLTHRVKGTR